MNEDGRRNRRFRRNTSNDNQMSNNRFAGVGYNSAPLLPPPDVERLSSGYPFPGEVSPLNTPVRRNHLERERNFSSLRGILSGDFLSEHLHHLGSQDDVRRREFVTPFNFLTGRINEVESINIVETDEVFSSDLSELSTSLETISDSETSSGIDEPFDIISPRNIWHLARSINHTLRPFNHMDPLYILDLFGITQFGIPFNVIEQRNHLERERHLSSLVEMFRRHFYDELLDNLGSEDDARRPEPVAQEFVTPFNLFTDRINGVESTLIEETDEEFSAVMSESSTSLETTSDSEPPSGIGPPISNISAGNTQIPQILRSFTAQQFNEIQPNWAFDLNHSNTLMFIARIGFNMPHDYVVVGNPDVSIRDVVTLNYKVPVNMATEQLTDVWDRINPIWPNHHGQLLDGIDIRRYDVQELHNVMQPEIGSTLDTI